MKSKMRIGFALLAILMVFAIAGCKKSGGSSGGSSGSAGSKAATVNINFTVMSGVEDVATWQEIIDLYMRQNPNVKISMENVPGGWEGYTQKLNTLFAGGTPPDTGRLASLQKPMYISMGRVVDLTDMMARDLNMSEYNASVFEGNKVNGRHWGLPQGIYTLVVVYNKDLFDQAGIKYPNPDWENTWTLAEFQDIARKLTKGTGPNKQFGFYANISPERCNVFHYGEGADIFSDDGRTCLLDSPGMISTYEWNVDMIKKEIAPSMLQGARDPPIAEYFMTNRLGMYVTGQWEMQALSQAAQEDGFRFGIAPIPRGSVGSRTVIFLDDYVIFTGSKQVEEAWKQIKYMIGPDATEIKIKNNALGMPMHQPTLNRMMGQVYTAISDGEKNVHFKSPDYGKVMYFTKNWPEMLEAFLKMNDLLVLNQVSVPNGFRQLKGTLEELNKANF